MDKQDGAERPSVHLERVTKRFGDFTAVRELSLSVRRGEFFTLLGPRSRFRSTTS
jgi:putrescine transport system ATP-binding protein